MTPTTSNTMDDGSDHGSLCLTSCCVAPTPLVHNEAAVDTAALEGGPMDVPSMNEAYEVHKLLRLRADARRSFCKLGRCGGASSGKDVRRPTLHTKPIPNASILSRATSIHRPPSLYVPSQLAGPPGSSVRGRPERNPPAEGSPPRA